MGRVGQFVRVYADRAAFNSAPNTRKIFEAIWFRRASERLMQTRAEGRIRMRPTGRFAFRRSGTGFREDGRTHCFADRLTCISCRQTAFV